MGLDFGKSSMGNPAQAGNGLQEKNEIEVVEKYDIVADRQQMNAELVNSKEVDDIVSTIEVYNMDTIVSFGAKAAEEISKASDVVLNSMNMSQLNETSEMLKSLAKIMDQFDINEIKDNPGLFGKLFGNFRKQLDKILAKYHTMGEEVDKIYVGKVLLQLLLFQWRSPPQDHNGSVPSHWIHLPDGCKSLKPVRSSDVLLLHHKW